MFAKLASMALYGPLGSERKRPPWSTHEPDSRLGEEATPMMLSREPRVETL
jgi:hypothetical protein